MNVLITLHPLLGHLHPLVPLARALRDAGHRVRFATARRFAPFIERTGFEHLHAGVDHPGDTLLFTTLREQGLMSESAKPGPHIFSDIMAPVMVHDLLACLPRDKPDVIIHDPVELGGCLAAEVLGIPHAAFSWAFHWPAETRRAWWAEGWQALRREFGLVSDPIVDTLCSQLVIDYMPPLWAEPARPRPATALSVNAPLYDRIDGADLPGWIADLPDKPIVYATLGTALNQNPPLFRGIAGALSELDVNGIITVGPGVDRGVLAGLPAHVHVAEYIPQSLLLPHCQLVIAHGGYNTLIAALKHGLPLVLTPLTAKDQPINAARAEALGLGRVVTAEGENPGPLAAAVGAVLEDPAYRQRARQIAGAIEDLPPLTVAVQRLEQLAATAFPA